MRRAALATLLGLSLAATTLAAAQAQAAPRQADLAALVKVENVRHHQLNLQKISDANGGNRAAGLPGNVITVKYIADQLKRAGYSPTVQNFQFDFWQETAEPSFAQTAPEQKTFEPGTDFQTLQYSGSGDVTGAASPVDPGATGLGSGCEADDFAGFPKGRIALIQRGGCFYSVKADNAIAAGAAAIVIYQLPGQPGPVAGTLTKPYGVPVIGPTNAIGKALVEQAQSGGVTLRVKTETFTEKRGAANVVADTGRGRADNVVVVGAHNDSVIEGPGINDNGSGVAALLELAKQINKLGDKQLRNKVRFAFWGAEEEGLLGSQYYVANLPQAERDKIALNLNFDMIGSPNFVRFVYDGDNSTGAAPSRRPPGPARSRRRSPTTSPSASSPPTRRPSTGGRTTTPSSPWASPPAACSPARRASRRPSRPRCTAARPAWPTTRATTRSATGTTTSTSRASTRCSTGRPRSRSCSPTAP